ncbi:MAG: hypothetical protein K8Q99_00885 [Acholeplasmataceae bacterium]|nr:hypothetical protein [Acholeplasmataceae bacterium]
MNIKIKDRILVMLSSFFYGVLGYFFTGSLWWFLIVLAALLFVCIGGKKHV